MKKKFIFITFLCLLLCSGCTKYEELNSLSIISNITIEKVQDTYKVVMQEIIRTKKDKGVSYTYNY